MSTIAVMNRAHQPRNTMNEGTMTKERSQWM